MGQTKITPLISPSINFAKPVVNNLLLLTSILKLESFNSRVPPVGTISKVWITSYKALSRLMLPTWLIKISLRLLLSLASKRTKGASYCAGPTSPFGTKTVIPDLVLFICVRLRISTIGLNLLISSVR